MAGFDLPGVLRRVRRGADLSQRQLAERIGVSKSCVAAAESGTSGLDARVLARAAALAGLRLALVDGQGAEVPAMDGETVRDMGNRRFPAHLDTRYGDEDWWHDAHRYSRPRPWYTFDRDRGRRDARRRRAGPPADHQLPQPGDAPEHRAAQRRRAALRRAAEERRQRAEEARRRRAASGESAEVGLGFVCDCPDACDQLDDRSGRPVHAPECPCGCDVG
ncbi:MAG TPA: helix-turn-helix transcriptional regulator [Geodermatophilus sp.]|nr:helix-turn-helix transcriptional regulator [Geodermatophilus sp.]